MGVELETNQELRETGNDKLNSQETKQTRKPEYKTKPEKYKNNKDHDNCNDSRSNKLKFGVVKGHKAKGIQLDQQKFQ